MTGHCAHCDKPLTRVKRDSGWESHVAFNKRKYCNVTCRRAAFTAEADRARREVNGTRKCEYCNKTLHLTPGRSISEYLVRRFCDRACHGAWQAAHQPHLENHKQHRRCRHCREPLTRRVNEAANDFRSRVMCNQTCYDAYRARSAAEKRRRRNERVRAKRAADRAAGKTPRPATRRKTSRFVTDATTLPVTQLKRERHETIRLEVLGEPCPHHPGEKVGWFGCTACNASAKWRSEQNRVRYRPRSDAPSWTKTR